MQLGKGVDARKWTQDDLKLIKERGLAEFRNAKTLFATPGEQKDLLIRGDVVLTTRCYDAVAIGATAQGAKVRAALHLGRHVFSIFNGARNIDAAYAYWNTALSPEGQAIMAKKMELLVSNQRALVLEQKVLLLDEPLGSLNLKLRKEMQNPLTLYMLIFFVIPVGTLLLYSFWTVREWNVVQVCGRDESASAGTAGDRRPASCGSAGHLQR